MPESKNKDMARIFFIYLMLHLSSLPAAAQQNVIIEEDAPIGEMMKRYAEINQSKPFITGWRVQIIATPDRQRLESVRQSFQYRYPSIPVDWVHDKPYYKLRAGAFSSRLEAMRLRHILERDYPGLYLVRDEAIRPRDMIGAY